MGLGNKLISLFLNMAIVFGVILIIPGLPPYLKLESFTASPPLRFEGTLDSKDYVLSKAEKLFKGQLIGPESLEVSPVNPNTFYTTLHGGTIVKIFGNGTQMKTVAKFGKNCAGNWDSKNCGRPLGIRFDKDGYLIAADSYLGIYKVDCQVSNLVSKDVVIDGKTAKIFNSVAPAKDGKIYYTVSSTTYLFNEALGEMLGAPSGRLMVYDSTTKESKVLLEEMHFANGIILSPDEDFLVFAECLRFRLHKYFIKGPKAGTTEIFLDQLPGSPDNLNFTPEGNILVALVTVRIPEQFDPLVFAYSHPWLRKLVIRIMHIVKYPFDLASKYLDITVAEQIASHVMNLELILPTLPEHGIILEVDWTGRIVNSWHSNSPDIRFFSDAKIINGYMYLGSPFNDFIGRVKLPNYV